MAKDQHFDIFLAANLFAGCRDEDNKIVIDEYIKGYREISKFVVVWL